MGKRIEVKPGTRFGRLTVVKEVAPRNKHRYMLVKCTCGTKKEVMLQNLRSGDTKSCGCLRSERNEIPPGTRFCRWTVLKEAASRGKKRYVLVLCDCGIKREVLLTSLRRGGTRSCGCLQREWVIHKNTTHGMSSERIYRIWKGMTQRCSNTANPSYESYGGRGITICKAWSDPKKFIKWALDNGYQDNLSIDRINNDKGYFPSNCHWANASQQKRNQRMKTNSSGFVGVRKQGRKWGARVKVQGKTIYFGTFGDPFSAAWVRDEYVKNIDQFATTNNLQDRRKRKKRVEVERRGVQQ